MSEPYQNINRELAKSIRLIMSDVDGTLTANESLSSSVIGIVHQLEQNGINVGLVSGRPLKRLEIHAQAMGISGPIIAENGGIARLSLKDGLLDLSYTRKPALEAFEMLERVFPGNITVLPDNTDRMVDVTFSAKEINTAQLMKYLTDVQLLDSGYMLHLLPLGISKGNTLKRLLTYPTYQHISQDAVMVFGDSATDMSLFTQFYNSVLVLNPLVAEEQRNELLKVTRFQSDHFCGYGFIEVCGHLLKVLAK
jgi:hydroxymethylpyrimidine pyrophosphatase-like HAD family hydrolase